MTISTLPRADQLAAVLEALTVRVVIGDAGAVNAPCVLLVPPRTVRYDLACGATAYWAAYALAAGTSAADRDTWSQLEELRDAAALVWPIESAELQVYVVNGVSYPAYALTWTEAIA